RALSQSWSARCHVLGGGLGARQVLPTGRTLFWPLTSRYGRRTRATFASLPGVTSGTALDPTCSRPRQTGFAHGLRARLQPCLFRVSATPPLPEARRRGRILRPRNSSVPHAGPSARGRSWRAGPCRRRIGAAGWRSSSGSSEEWGIRLLVTPGTRGEE